MDTAIAAEVQEVGLDTIRSSRPVAAAVAADTVQRAVAAVARARGRVPDSQVCSEISEEVYALASGVISSILGF